MSVVTADLLRALQGAGYHVALTEDRLNVKPPAAGMSPALRDRVAEQRDTLKALLRSNDPFVDCTPCDPLILTLEACRFPPEHHAALVTTYLDRFAATGHAVEAEIAAWFAAVLETERERGEPDAGAIASSSSRNGREQTGRVVIWVCASCGLPRSRRPEPCPACGALGGCNYFPEEDAA